MTFCVCRREGGTCQHCAPHPDPLWHQRASVSVRDFDWRPSRESDELLRDHINADAMLSRKVSENTAKYPTDSDTNAPPISVIDETELEEG